MSQDKCPRCLHQGEASGIKDFGTAKYWGCGTWQGESGAIYESELCETRQELQSLQNGLIAELCPCGRADGYECEQHSFDLLMRVRETKARAEKAEAELAKRERALEQASIYYRAYDHDQRMRGSDESSTAYAAKKAPDYAEWLKNREEKK